MDVGGCHNGTIAAVAADNGASSAATSAKIAVVPDENDNQTNVMKQKGSPTIINPVAAKMDVDSVAIGIVGDQQQSSSEDKPILTIESESVQKLDVPSKELQCIQKQVLIERLMTNPIDSSTPENTISQPMDTVTVTESSSACGTKIGKQSSKRTSRIPQNQPRKTFKLESSLLGKVKSFLVDMKAANEDLLRLPDPSKLSLESVSDYDEMDGAKPGTSSSSMSYKLGKGNKSEEGEGEDTKTFVEMNLALVDNSDSDTSSDGEDFIMPSKKNETVRLPSPKKLRPESTEQVPLTLDEGKEETGRKNLITELN